MKIISLAVVALLGAVNAVTIRKTHHTPIDALQFTQVDSQGEDYGHDCDDHDD